MAEVDKVSVKFDADVNSFTRGVKRMEKDLDNFNRKADKTEKNVNTRLDLMDAQANKLNKTLKETGDDIDLTDLMKQISDARAEYESTGVVAQKTMRQLNDEINKVDMSKMSKRSSAAFKTLTNDVNKLNKQTTELRNNKFASTFEGQAKIGTKSLHEILGSMKEVKKQQAELKQSMDGDTFKGFQNSMAGMRKQVTQARKELREMGVVSNQTMQALNKQIDSVNFKKLSRNSNVEFNKIKANVKSLNATFNTVGKSTSRASIYMQGFTNKSRVGLKTLQGDFKKTIVNINRIGTAFRNIGEVAAGSIRGIVMAVLPGIIPVAGAAATSVMTIATSLTAVAGGAVGLGGAFGIGLGAIKVFAAQGAYALKMLEDGTLKVTNEVRRYQGALASLKTSWEALIAQNQAQIFNTMTNGIKGAEYALATLNPFLTKTAQQIEIASGKMLKWVQSSNNAQAAFQMLNTRGPAIFQNLLNSAGYFGNGMTRIFTLLGPLFTWTAQGLENLSKRFNTFANSAQAKQGIADFINYTKTNLPTLGSIFGNTFMGIFALFRAFSGQTQWVLGGLDNLTLRFRKWAETLDQTQGFKDFIAYTRANAPIAGQFIGNLVNILVAFVSAAAPVGAVVLRIATAFTGWIAKMLQSHPIIAQLIGSMIAFGGVFKLLAIAVGLFYSPLSRMVRTFGLLFFGVGKATGALRLFTVAQKAAALAARGLGLAMTFITGPIGIAVAAIAAVSAALIYLYKNNETFRNAVNQTWNTIKVAAIATFGFLKPYLLAIWNGIRNAAIAIWNGIKFAITNPIQATKNIVMAIWNFLKSATLAIWNSIKTGVLLIFSLWLKGVRMYLNAIRAVFTVVWNAIKTFVIRAAQAISSGVRSRFALMVAAVKVVIGSLRSFLVAAWTAIRNTVVKFAVSIYNGVRARFNALSAIVRLIITNLRKFLSTAWNAIRNTVVRIVVSLYNGIKARFNALSAIVRLIITNLRKFLSTAWNAIKNIVIKFATSLYNGVKSRFNKLSAIVRLIIANLRKWLTSTWNSIRNTVVSIVGRLWNSVRNTFNKFSAGTKAIFSNLGKRLRAIWNGIKSAITGIVSKLWNTVRNTFNNMRNGLANIIGKIKGHITGMVNAVKKGLNKLIKGVNWVADKIGMEKFPYLSTGTTATHTKNFVTNGKINQDTMAVVGDKGRGNGPRGFRHETIIPPKGKPFITPATDSVVPLQKGSVVLSGQQTYDTFVAPRYNTGTLPRFNGGSIKDKALGAMAGAYGYVSKRSKDTEKALNATGNGIAEAVSDTIAFGKDIFEYASNPGSLVTKVLDKFGVNFNNIKGDLLGGMVRAMFKKLKNGVKELFKGWLEDAGGGDASKLTRYPLIQPFGRYRGGLMFNGGRHYGVDFAYPYGANVYATNSGTVSPIHDYGGGLIARLITGQFTLFFMHLSKILKTGRVNSGDLIAKSGNSGNFTTGPHLHFQVNKGIDNYVNNSHAIDPMKWLAGHGGGGSGGGSWSSKIRRAAARMGVRVSSGDVSDISRLIQTESSGNESIIQQIVDINTGANRARGLLQYTPGTFASYKVPGAGNIMNGMHQLMAFFNNSNWRRDLSAWKSRMARGITGWGPSGARRRENGGIVNSLELAWLADGGFSESVISHDPANKIKSKAIWDRTGEMLGYSDDYDLLKELVALQRENNSYAKGTRDNTASANTPIIQMDGKKVGKAVAPYVKEENAKQQRVKDRFKGGTI
ncbi:peptidoglycan DD-metalloendopeptidase family protein [Staphylococcus chromogenes]|uniref:peptidoglycan DD-metalloendopeptidase family protein n=1 Tax=Staphylococcus chromogenes TaxID=46126 RepID=UPI002DB72BEB|nr:peptidoglycan DD-metalloendopeptidase family protein [Staphylococcus chromogenes]MEB7449867.1 peptidoglycan DD-metalloendopeptidase family protein [Staphylococcus chromogenes]